MEADAGRAEHERVVRAAGGEAGGPVSAVGMAADQSRARGGDRGGHGSRSSSQLPAVRAISDRPARPWQSVASVGGDCQFRRMRPGSSYRGRGRRPRGPRRVAGRGSRPGRGPGRCRGRRGTRPSRSGGCRRQARFPGRPAQVGPVALPRGRTARPRRRRRRGRRRGNPSRPVAAWSSSRASPSPEAPWARPVRSDARRRRARTSGRRPRPAPLPLACGGAEEFFAEPDRQVDQRRAAQRTRQREERRDRAGAARR